MPPSAKRRKRVLILAGGAVALVVAGAGAYGFRQFRMNRWDREQRDLGHAAYERADFPKAVEGLGKYIRRLGNREGTARDFRTYAQALRRVPMPKNQHLGAAIGALRRAMELEPRSREIQEELLDLYSQYGYTAEALDLADRMLLAAPTDARVLGTKADLLEFLRQYPKAQEAADRACEVSPSDYAAHLRALRLRLLQSASAAEVDAWIGKVLASRTGDRRFDLLRVVVLQTRSQREEAGKLLDEVLASAIDGSDAAFVASLVGQLDAAERFADSLKVLGRAEDSADAHVRVELARRLWYAGRHDDLLARTGPWTRDAAAAEPELLVLRALALAAADRKEDAEAVRRSVAARADAAGGAWTAYLDHALGRTSGAAASRESLARAAVVLPGSALVRQALGDTLALVREGEAAVQAWRVTALLAPSWSRPHVAMAGAHLAIGEPRIAVIEARAALVRAPNDVNAVVAWIQANGADVEDMTEARAEQLLRAAESLRREVPEAASAVLPLEVDILARQNRAAALSRIEAVLSSEDRPDEATLIRLSEVARRVDPALEVRVLDLSQAVHGITPNLALARAIAEVRGSTADAGVRRFDELRHRAPGGGPGFEWELLRAALLDALGRSEAGPAWIAMSDAHPGELRAQLGVLACSGAWSDRGAVRRAIDRLRALTGDDGVAWRTADARWKVTAADATEADLAEATRSLADVVRDAPQSLQARALLAQAFERLGNLPSAEEQWRLASDLAADNAWIALQRARLAQRQGRSEEARRHLDRALAAKDLAPPLAEQAAFLLAMQGDLKRTVSVLEPLAAGAKSRAGLLLLAQSHARMGQAERALEICRQLLDRPTPAVVQLAADLCATLGRRPDADELLAGAGAMGFQSGDAELVRARFAVRWSTPEAAAREFRAAVDAAPEREETWVALLTHVLTYGDVPALEAILADPRAAKVEAVAFAASNRTVLASGLSDARLRPILAEALDRASNRKLLLDAVRIASEARENPAKTEDAARRVIRLADENVRILPLQALGVDMAARVGDLRKAVEISRRAAVEFPNSAAAARMAAETLAASRRWADAYEAALLWRDRTGSLDLRPQAFVASTLLRLGRASEAVESLEPHAQVALSRPDENRDVLVTWVVALARAGNIQRAAEQMRNLAARSAAWRTIPLAVGSDWMGDAEGAVAWLRACAANVPESDVQARLRLARAWGSAWEAYRSPELLAGARAVLDALVAAPDAAAETYFLAGTLNQQVGDVAAAKAAYLTALRRDPRHVAARNNLAMVLADQGAWEEAAGHARAALEAHPGHPEFLDTLAYCLRKGRKYDEAKARLEEAIRVEPGNPTWRVSLAEILAETGDRDGLAQTLARIEEMTATGGMLRPDLATRVANIRERR